MSITSPAGFRAAGVAAGLKTSGGKDLALVVNDGPNHDSASVFTSNRCKANPILWSQEVVKDGVVRAVVLNSGGANCYTGAEGFQTTHAVAEQVAGHLGIGAGDVVVCSTGLIGLANPRQNLLDGVDAAYAALGADGGNDAAEAIIVAARMYEGAEPVNLGTGREISIRNLSELIAKLTGFTGTFAWNPDKPDGQPIGQRRLPLLPCCSHSSWPYTSDSGRAFAATIRPSA